MEEHSSRERQNENPEGLSGDQQREHQDDIFSTVVRAGKRTYFFDVKSTRSNELYLTITESKKRFNQQSGRFFYEKHKLFLYREDFDKFRDALKESFAAVDSLQGEIVPNNPVDRQGAGSVGISGSGDRKDHNSGMDSPSDED
jgi:hypothetical protein